MTRKFWKFASDVKGQEKLITVFNKFASTEKLSAFNAEYLWKAVNKDVEKAFIKQAAETNSKIVSTAIKTVMEALPEVIQSVSLDSSEPVEKTPDTAAPVESESVEPKSEPKSADESKDNKSEDANTGTVFDRLGE